MIQDAILYMTEKHKEQKRIGGNPYYVHPLCVSISLAEKGFGLNYQLAGLFHDLLEDTDAKEEEILEYGGEDVLTAVKLVTKTKGYQMDEYVNGIVGNHISKMVKLADRVDNLRSALIANLKFRKKYVLETEQYYLSMAMGTPFEADMQDAYEALKKSL